MKTKVFKPRAGTIEVDLLIHRDGKVAITMDGDCYQTDPYGNWIYVMNTKDIQEYKKLFDSQEIY